MFTSQSVPFRSTCWLSYKAGFPQEENVWPSHILVADCDVLTIRPHHKMTEVCLRRILRSNCRSVVPYYEPQYPYFAQNQWLPYKRFLKMHFGKPCLSSSQARFRKHVLKWRSQQLLVLRRNDRTSVLGKVLDLLQLDLPVRASRRQNGEEMSTCRTCMI